MDQDYITRREHEEFSRRIDAENERQNKRIGVLEESVAQMTQLTVSVEKMASNMEYMAKEQASQGERLKEQDKKLDELKAEPGKKWTAVVYGIIGAIAAAIGAAIMAGIIH